VLIFPGREGSCSAADLRLIFDRDFCNGRRDDWSCRFCLHSVTISAVNRKDFQALSSVRLKEARALLRLREYSGAYYLAGYAVECALKACIAKKVKRYDFPDRQVRDSDPYVHDLVRLAALAGLKDLIRSNGDIEFQANWDVTILWTEQSRYKVFEQQESERLINAIMNKRHGVMPWIKQRW
jgi:hypothetical protein